MQMLMHNNQKGMVLVLAMFMLALLSMIGVASMMTTTTDIEIATGEQQYVETFYRTQAAHTIAGELLLMAQYDRGFGAAETVDPDGENVPFSEIDDYTFAFRLIDPDMFKEDFESTQKITASGNKIWQVDDQEIDQLPCPQDMTASECAALNAKIGTEDLDLWTDIRLVRGQGDQEVVVADIDIDKIESKTMVGGGAEFGASDLGMGSNAAIVTYNIDARSRLSTGDFNKSPSRQALGMRVVVQ